MHHQIIDTPPAPKNQMKAFVNTGQHFVENRQLWHGFFARLPQIVSGRPVDNSCQTNFFQNILLPSEESMHPVGRQAKQAYRKLLTNA